MIDVFSQSLMGQPFKEQKYFVHELSQRRGKKSINILNSVTKA